MQPAYSFQLDLFCVVSRRQNTHVFQLSVLLLAQLFLCDSDLVSCFQVFLVLWFSLSYIRNH